MHTLPKSPVFSATDLLAEGLAANRAELGWTQEFLAAQCGLSTRTVWEIEAGVGNPRLSTISEIARQLGTTLLGLFTDGYDAMAVSG